MAIKQTAELERILQQAADRDASDVFLLPGEPVCFRIRGAVQRSDSAPLTAEQVKEIAQAAVGPEAMEGIRARAGGCVTSCGLTGVVNGRLTVTSALGDWTVTLRIFPGNVLDPRSIGMPAAALEAAQASAGLVVFAGETGSGKTTTALSFLDHINATRPVRICTIEDPLGTRLTPKQAVVQQHEVGTDVPSTLAALRYVLAEDVDVLYLDVVRSVEEVQALVTAADIGHLVVTVVHAPSPQEAVNRLVEVLKAVGIPGFCRRLARVLRLVCCQQLLPTVRGGRVAAYGVLVPDGRVREAIATGKSVSDCPLPADSQIMAEHVRRLREAGIISAQVADQALKGLT